MRIQLNIQATQKVIPLDHQPLLSHTILKWMGLKVGKSQLPPFAFSRLEEARATLEGTIINKETAFFISCPDTELIHILISGIQADPTLFNGLKVVEKTIIENPDLSQRKLFYLGSPILLKHVTGGEKEHILYNDIRADDLLKKSLETKLKAAGITDDTFDVFFDKTYTSADPKKIIYKGLYYRTSWCHVIIKGKPETKLLAWNTGLGDDNNNGFGAIM